MWVGVEHRVNMEGQAESEIPPRSTEVSDRLDEAEQQIERLQNTLRALARETSDIAISGPCGHCDQCFLFLKDGMMYCPQCGNGRSM